MSERLNAKRDGLFKYAAWFVAAATLAIRFAFIYFFSETALFQQVQGGHDRALYHQAAQAVAAGAWWPEGSFAYLPLYPWVLGLAYALAGPHLIVAAGLGLMVETVTSYLLVRLARRLGASTPWAVAAGLLYALYPRAVAYTALTMPTSLNVLLVTALACALLPTTPRTWFGAIGLGLLAGLAGLGYPALWPAVLIVAVTALAGRAIAGLSKQHALVFAAAALLPVLPVVIHNSRAEGQLTGLTTHGGINVYMGNHERATGYPLRIRDFRMTARELLDDAHRAAEQEVGHPLNRAASSRWWSDQARRYLREHPADYARLLARKCRLFWSGTDVDDLRMVEQIRLMHGQLTGPWWTCFAWFSLAGLFGLLRSGPAPAARLLAWSSIAAVVSLFITTRYRLPLAPLLAAFGAAGFTVLVRDLRARQHLPGHALALALAVGLAAWPGGVPDVRATDHYNASVQWLAAGKADRALAEARAGLDLDAQSADLYHAEGSALFKQEKYAEAAPAFARAAALRPRHPNARFNLALSLARAGQVCEALRELEKDPSPGEREQSLMATLRSLCQQR